MEPAKALGPPPPVEPPKPAPPPLPLEPESAPFGPGEQDLFAGPDAPEAPGWLGEDLFDKAEPSPTPPSQGVSSWPQTASWPAPETETSSWPASTPEKKPKPAPAPSWPAAEPVEKAGPAPAWPAADPAEKPKPAAAWPAPDPEDQPPRAARPEPAPAWPAADAEDEPPRAARPQKPATSWPAPEPEPKKSASGERPAAAPAKAAPSAKPEPSPKAAPRPVEDVSRLRAHPDAVRTVYNALKEIGGDVTAVLVWEGSLVLRHLKGATGSEFPALQPAINKARETLKPQLIHDTRQQTEYSDSKKLFRSGVCVPLIREELVLAVLFVGSKSIGAFDSRTVKLVENLARQLDRSFTTEAVPEPKKSGCLGGFFKRLFGR